MKFRKKPVVIEAAQWTGHNIEEIVAFAGKPLEFPGMTLADGRRIAVIPTLEGHMTAWPGDWIIRGVEGEIYPCKPDIFAKTYEAV